MEFAQNLDNSPLFLIIGLSSKKKKKKAHWAVRSLRNKTKHPREGSHAFDIKALPSALVGYWSDTRSCPQAAAACGQASAPHSGDEGGLASKPPENVQRKQNTVVRGKYKFFKA